MGTIRVIIGKDDFIVNEKAKKYIGAGDGLEVIDAATASNADDQMKSITAAEASFFTPPLFEPSKTTWWRDVRFLPGARARKGEDGGEDKISEAVKEALEQFAAKLAACTIPDNQTFILTAPTLLKTSIFAKKLEPIAEIEVLEEKTGYAKLNEALSLAEEFAAAEGFAFAPSAAQAFVSRVGTDSRSLLQEVRKLRAYLDPAAKEATAADVSQITSPGVGVEPSVWEVTDALSARNTVALVAALRQFEGESGFAVIMTTVAEKCVRQLLEIKAAQAANVDERELGRGMSPYAFKKVCGFAANWTLLELRRARERLMLLREKVVSAAGSSDTLVFTELIRICRRPVRRGRG